MEPTNVTEVQSWIQTHTHSDAAGSERFILKSDMSLSGSFPQFPSFFRSLAKYLRWLINIELFGLAAAGVCI